MPCGIAEPGVEEASVDEGELNGWMSCSIVVEVHSSFVRPAGGGSNLPDLRTRAIAIKLPGLVAMALWNQATVGGWTPDYH